MSETERVRAEASAAPAPRAWPAEALPAEALPADDVVHVDCDCCEVRGVACGDCIVTVLLGAPPEGVELDPDERRALDVLAGSGLVPPLRLVPSRLPRPEG